MLIRRKINRKKITKAKYIRVWTQTDEQRKENVANCWLVRSVSTPVIKEIQIEAERRYLLYKVSKCFRNRSILV